RAAAPGARDRSARPAPRLPTPAPPPRRAACGRPTPRCAPDHARSPHPLKLLPPGRAQPTPLGPPRSGRCANVARDVRGAVGSPSYAGIVVIGDPLPVGGILPAVGDLVDLAGTVRETSRSGYAGSRTDIEALTFLAPRGVAPLPAPASVTPAEIALNGVRAEEYEGVLVKTTAVTVGLTEPGFGIFTVTSGLIV